MNSSGRGGGTGGVGGTGVGGVGVGGTGFSFLLVSPTDKPMMSASAQTMKMMIQSLYFLHLSGLVFAWLMSAGCISFSFSWTGIIALMDEYLLCS